MAQESQRLNQQNQQQQLEIERLRREVIELREERSLAVTESRLSPRTDVKTTVQLMVMRRDREASAPPVDLGANFRVNSKADSIEREVTSEEKRGLFTLTTGGHLDKVRECLKRNRNLVHAQDVIHDVGHYFHKITGFQHAIWSGDEELWNIFLEFLPETEAYDQLMALIDERPDITKIHGAPLSSLDRLISAYEFYIANPTSDNWNGMVGFVLWHMPAWFVHIFSESGTDKAWPLKQMTRGFNRDADPRAYFQAAKMGGLDRGTMGSWIGGRRTGKIEAVQHDLENTIALKSECTKKLAALKERLSQAAKSEASISSSPFRLRK